MNIFKHKLSTLVKTTIHTDLHTNDNGIIPADEMKITNDNAVIGIQVKDDISQPFKFK